MSNAFDPLNAIVKAIDDHPHTAHLIQEYQDMERRSTLSLSDSQLKENSPPDYQKLIDKLDEELCGSFISAEGQHSKMYYQAKTQGYKTSVAESDSFGPLICCFQPGHGNWRFYYG